MKPSPPQPISIWIPRKIGESEAFVRPEPYPLGDHYSDRRVIFKEKTPGGTRICFFGESVAAGYLYAPYLTPAKILESQLAEICGESTFEVIDLAKTNETLDHLTETVESSLQIAPDVLIVFVGNNWTMLETPEMSPYRPSVEGRSDYARLLREQGLFGPVNQAARRVLEKAGNTFTRIDRVARAAAAKVILVVPETNLADWENRQPAPWLPGNDTAQWYVHYRQALAYLDAGDWAAAEEAAWKMEDLDGTLNPSTYRILAKAFMGKGEAKKARMACQAEVDANRYTSLGFLGAPQINSMAQQLQREAARYHDFSLVDLPDVFAIYTNSPLPGKRMFLDYCHLTVEGMKVAMAAIVEKVLVATRHSKQGISWKTLVQQLPDPAIAPAADATAKFGAAIHTSHRHLSVGSEQNIPEYWCREALKADPGIRHTMLDFIEARLSGLPTVLTAMQQRNLASPYPLMMQHGWQYDFLDASTIQAVAKAIDPNLDQELAGLIKGAKATHGSVELIYPLHALWHPVERFYPEVMGFRDISDRAFFRAAWYETSFALTGIPSEVHSLKLVLRLPPIPGSQHPRTGEIKVSVNNLAVGYLKAGEQWTQHKLLLPPTLFSAFLNKLTLHWPPLPPAGDAAIVDIINRLEQGLETDLHPVFGEIFSLSV